MDVTQENFLEAMTLLEQVLPRAEFVSFDGEYTGLGETPSVESEDGYARYERMLRGVRANCFMQFGVVVWVPDPESNSPRGGYIAYPFNFNVRPHNLPEYKYTPSFTMTLDTLQFHVSNHFDFNKWAYRAVPFVPNSVRDEMRKHADSFDRLDALPGLPGLPSERARGDIEQALQQIRAWLTDPARQNERELRLSGRLTDIGLRDVLAQFPADSAPFVADPQGHPRDSLTTLALLRVPPDTTPAERRTLLQAWRRARVETVWGASRVLDAVLRARLPLVGHMMVFDLMFMHEAFLGPLPPRYDAFKQRIHQLMPRLFDTKLLALHVPGLDPRLAAGTLETQFRALRGGGGGGGGAAGAAAAADSDAAVSIRVAPELPDYESGEQLRMHEAGFDAFATGVIFLRHVERMLPALPRLDSLREALRLPPLAPLQSQAALFSTVYRTAFNTGPDALLLTGRACLLLTGPVRRGDATEAALLTLCDSLPGAALQWVGRAACVWVSPALRDEAAHLLRSALRGFTVTALG